MAGHSRWPGGAPGSYPSAPYPADVMAPVRRPGRLVGSAVMVMVVMAGLLVVFGLVLVTLANLGGGRFVPMLVVPLVLVVPLLGWMGWVAWALLAGRRWSRFMVTASALATVPLYLLYIWQMYDMLMTERHGGIFHLLQLGGYGVCCVNLVASVAAALLPLGDGVGRYLRRRA